MLYTPLNPPSVIGVVDAHINLQHVSGIQRDIMSFILLSGCCWLFDTSLLLMLTVGLGWHPVASNIVSSLAAAAIVYTVAHRRIHNGVSDGQRLRLAFYLFYTLGMILVASCLLNRLNALFSITLGSSALTVILSKVTVTPPQLLCNFIISRFVSRASL